MKIQYNNVILRHKLIVTYQKNFFFLNKMFAYFNFIINKPQYTFKIKANQQLYLKLEKTSKYDYEK